MKKHSLNGEWTLYKQGDPTPIPAHVPGCVHTDLLTHGLLPDPFYRDNELQQMWIGETDWRYVRAFDVQPELLAEGCLMLRCHGLDTLATLRLNGVEIGRADNMHRIWEFDVTAHTRLGTNTLEIDFAAPMPFVRRMDAERGVMAGWVEPMRINSGAWLRKEPCNFGWDWGPKMVTSGIWRDIELVAFSSARIADVLILQNHTSEQVDLTIHLMVEQETQNALQARVDVSYDGAVVAQSETALANGTTLTTLTIHNPHLWFPNDLGEQPLYWVSVTLLNDAGQALDRVEKRIGLRTLRLERQPDEWGESFHFSCNGVPFFAKGANWIPASPYPGAVTRAEYERLIQAAADAHMNMLRAWGGGIYENDDFYDLCDEYGIAVWQDFMFACGTYPSREAEFMANVAEEARDTVRRLRHHACMALWCGNNEIEQGLPHSPGWLESMSWEDYSRLFDDLLPSIVSTLAPQTDYWPGSPHNPCGDRTDYNSQNCGDSHLWGVWHGKEPFEWYRTRLDRFCSEFGFQSFPEPQTVYEFTEPDDRSITSYVMEHHQRSGIGNSVIIHYLLDWFRLPTSFEATLWLSQILQAMAMKYAIEHWRRHVPRSMGALYWQLNDMWPAPSWASLDWKGNWKALHHMARRFFAPLMLSCLEDSERSTVQIHISNDHGTTQSGVITYAVTDVRGKVLASGAVDAVVAARTSSCVYEIDASAVVAANSRRDVLVWAQMRIGDEVISEDLALFSRPKHLALSMPEITLTPNERTPDGWSVTLESRSVALYVWLELPGAAFSDNFFHLRPGIPKQVLVDAGNIAALRVQSLFDTYQPASGEPT